MTQDKTAELSKWIDPEVLALEVKSFADGLQHLVKSIVVGQAPGATKDQINDAEQAANALLRNATAAIRSVRLLETVAEDVAEQASKRRDSLMNAVFGPDEE